LLAGGARAQEIDNTVWEDSSNVEMFPQPAPAAVANNLNTVMANSVQTDTATVVAQSSVVQEAVVSGGTAREGWLIGMSIMLMAPLAALVLVKARRGKQNIQARAYHSKRSAALS
jgi:hypothetical protein